MSVGESELNPWAEFLGTVFAEDGLRRRGLDPEMPGLMRLHTEEGTSVYPTAQFTNLETAETSERFRHLWVERIQPNIDVIWDEYTICAYLIGPRAGFGERSIIGVLIDESADQAEVNDALNMVEEFRRAASL